MSATTTPITALPSLPSIKTPTLETNSYSDVFNPTPSVVSKIYTGAANLLSSQSPVSDIVDWIFIVLGIILIGASVFALLFDGLNSATTTGNKAANLGIKVVNLGKKVGKIAEVAE